MGRLLTLLRKKGADFSPLDLPGLALWLDASDLSTITHSSGAVSQWDDKSGNARHVVQATAASQPLTGTTTKNGLNVLTFDGVDDYLLRATTTGLDLANLSVFLVVEQAGSTDAGEGFFALSTSGNSDFLQSTGLGWERGESGEVMQVINDVLRTPWVGTPPTPFGIYGTVIDAGSLSLYLNGALANTATDDFGTHNGPIYVGARRLSSAPGAFLTGHVAEILVCDSGLSAADRQAVEAYFSNKWGVTLT